MGRTSLLTGFIVIAFILSLASCDRGAGQGSSAGRDRVRIQLNWVPEPEFGGLYAAELHGYFEEEGLEVELVKGGPGVAAPQLAASGSVEFAVVAGEQILTLGRAGGELVATFASFQSDPIAIMVHAESPWTSIEELWRSDATVACEDNLSFVKVLNRRYGGDRLRFVPHSGSVVQFAADPRLAQQCFIFAEPVALELRGIATRVFPSRDSGYDPYNVVIAASRRYAETHPETIRKLQRALARGWRRYLDEPGPTNAVMATLNPAMSREAMDLAAARLAGFIENDDTARLGLGAMTAERWAAIAEELASLGTIPSVPDVAAIFVAPETERQGAGLVRPRPR